MKTVLSITGMTCQNCVKHATNALLAVEGVAAATVDLSTGLAEVEGFAEVQDLIAAIEEEGYEAQLAD